MSINKSDLDSFGKNNDFFQSNSNNIEDIAEDGKEIFKSYNYDDKKVFAKAFNLIFNNNPSFDEDIDKEKIEDIYYIKKRKNRPEEDEKLKQEDLQNSYKKQKINETSFNKIINVEIADNNTISKNKSNMCIEPKDSNIKSISLSNEIKYFALFNPEIFDLFNFFYRENLKEKTNDLAEIDNLISRFLSELQDNKWKDLFKKYLKISDFSSIYKNNEENKETIAFLEKKPLEYIEEILNKIGSFTSNKKKKAKISFDKQKFEQLLRMFECFSKKEEKEKEKEKSKKILTKKEEKMKEKFDISIININQAYKSDEVLDQLNPFQENIEKNNNNINIFNWKNDIGDKTTASKTKTNIQWNEEIKKENRLDNLFIIIKNWILISFTEEFNRINPNNKLPIIDKAKSNEKINKEINENFFKSDFKEYFEECKKQLKEKKNIDILVESEEAIKLIETNKLDYLIKIVEEKGDEFFEKDKNEQIKKYQNLKCKNKALKLFQSKDFVGLIALLTVINIDGKLNPRISDPNKFEKIIQNLEGNENFKLELTSSEMEDIDKRIENLKNLALDPIGYLDNVSPKNK